MSSHGSELSHIVEIFMILLLLVGATVAFLFLMIWVSSKQRRHDAEVRAVLDRNPNVTLADVMDVENALKPRHTGAIRSQFAQHVAAEETLRPTSRLIDGHDYQQRLESFVLLYYSQPNLPGLREVIKLLQKIERAKMDSQVAVATDPQLLQKLNTDPPPPKILTKPPSARPTVDD